MFNKICSFLICFFVSIFFVSGCKSSTKQTESSYDYFRQVYNYEIYNNSIKILSHKYNKESRITVPEAIARKQVKILGKDAFYQHKKTVEIILPKSITTIEGAPFYRCYSLKNIWIPKNTTYIEANPFFRCPSLQKILVDSDNPNYLSENGILYNKEKTILLAYPEGKTDNEFIIPESVKKIGDDAFGYRTQIKKLIIRSNVTEFPDYNMFVFPNDITLVVEKNSVAEKYAEEYDLNFVIINNTKE